MNVFISHKQEDAIAAGLVANRCRAKQVACYLDLFDPIAASRGDALGDHIRNVMGFCTHLMAVVSEKTKESWWVPWEIGVATEKDFPISTYASGQCDLPIYLKKWPYLTQAQHIDLWIDTALEAERQTQRSRTLNETVNQARTRGVREFYTRVRRVLGQ